MYLLVFIIHPFLALAFIYLNWLVTRRLIIEIKKRKSKETSTTKISYSLKLTSSYITIAN